MKTKPPISLAVVFFWLITFIANAQTGTYIKADDANIQYTGRIDFTNPKAPIYSFPGVCIKANFTGSSISAVIKDYGMGGPQGVNCYEVIVDNVILNKVVVNTVDTLYALASGLSNSSHTVQLIKRTESSVGKSSFKGFVIEGSSLDLPPLALFHKIEFIGDSWTCGYGDEVSTNSPNTGFHSINEDNYRAWGSTVSIRLNAQYHATAISGRGLYRNNTGTTYGVLPDEFNKIFPGEATLWNFNTYIPDVVVIHLGTNDWYQETLSPPIMLDSAAYVNKYIVFINDIRSKYGVNTKIVCAFGNSKSDWWPTGLYHLTRWRNYVTAVVSHFNTAGDHEVYKFELSVQNAPYGEDWHPTITTHNQMANEITPYIASITGWTDNGYTAPTTTIVTEVRNTSNMKASFSLYPNPTQGSFLVDGLEDETPWEIIDSLGKVHLTGAGKTGTLQQLENGIYFFVAEGLTTKIVKH